MTTAWHFRLKGSGDPILMHRARHLLRELSMSSGASAALAAATAAGVGYRSTVGRRSLWLGSLAAGFLGWHYRDTAHRLERAIRSAEDAAALSVSLQSAAPIFGRWAVEGDFAGMIARELERSQRLVVECGSGVTSLVIANQLRQNGSGRLISLEHDAGYAARCTALLQRAGLGDFARVVVAPLRRQQVGEKTVDWYDRNVVEEAVEGEIDVLVVDGPPQISPWARWPALEVLYPRLAQEAVVLMDDGRTQQTTAHAWVERFPDLDLYWIDTLKGTWLLTRRDASGLSGRLLRIARMINPRPAGFGRWPVHR
jgi:predicted O-methyltransferase YrrM